MDRPFVVVSGLPGSGKTTLARQLADGLGLPLFDKDDILDQLFEANQLSSKYTDPFEFWDALFRMNPSTSALVELSPVAFNEQATEALAYCGYTVSPIGGEESLVAAAD